MADAGCRQVWELDGPMPTLKRSKTLIAMLKPIPAMEDESLPFL
jgi:hypothetical protein